MVTKAHLTQEGLREIIQIMSSNNKSLHIDLLKEFNTNSVDKPVYKENNLPCNPW